MRVKQTALYYEDDNAGHNNHHGCYHDDDHLPDHDQYHEYDSNHDDDHDHVVTLVAILGPSQVMRESERSDAALAQAQLCNSFANPYRDDDIDDE